MMYVLSVVLISIFLYHYYALGKLYNVVVAFHGYQYKSFGHKIGVYSSLTTCVLTSIHVTLALLVFELSALGKKLSGLSLGALIFDI